MPPKLLIIADDLTGANDTAVQFARQGITSLVVIDPAQDLASFARDCQVLVANTESRHLKPAEAFQRVQRAAQQGAQLGIRQFYKKIDSTLRGNVGAELAAVMKATNARQLFFAPAYPKLRRTTRQGVQYVDGVPLDQSSFAHDPLAPSREASIAAILARQTNLAVRPFATLADNDPAPTIYVVDAATDADLQAAAQLLRQETLLAGSAGWAEFLATTMNAKCASLPTASVSPPLLIVNGSRHEASLQQVAHAAQHGVGVIEWTAEDAAAQVCEQLTTQQRAILTTSTTRQEAQAAARLAGVVSTVLDQASIKTFVVFGGDTLAAIAAVRGWTAFQPRAEFLPGVPLVAVCEEREFALLTKAGGFGAEDLLLRLTNT
jgi:uncharacterized protein YgbK (DUF1537 family)